MKSNKKNKLLKILIKKKIHIFKFKKKFITFPTQKQFIIQKIFHINGINLEKHN